MLRHNALPTLLLAGLVPAMTLAGGAPTPARPPAFSTPRPAGILNLHHVATARLNADTHDDLIGIGPDLRVFLGRGDGTFDPQPPYAIPAPGKPQLVVTDVNGDDAPDAVVSTTGDDVFTITVFLNDGAGAFTPGAPHVLGTPQGPSLPTLVADFTGDDAPDILAQWSDTEPALVLVNQGAGVFAPAPTSAGAGVSGRLAAELTGDDAADLVAWGDGHVTIFKSLADGSFAQEFSAEFDAASPVRVADIDDDDDDDLIAPGSYRLLIVRNEGTGGFTPEVCVHGAGEVADVIDTNSDGAPDIVLTGAGGLATLLNDTHGDFPLPRTYPTDALDFFTADVDTDGDDDVVLNLESTLYVRLNNGDGTLAAPAPLDFGPAPQRVTGFVAADLDGDSVNDLIEIATLDQEAGLVELRALMGGPHSSDVRTWPLPQPCVGPGCSDYGPPGNLVATDLDDDGDLDLTMADDRFLVFLNDGAANMSPTQNIEVYASALHTIADVNNDGTLDALVSSYDSVSILLGLGGATFGPPTALPTPHYAGSALAADLTGDDAPELILVGHHGIFILRNDGAGAFPGPTMLLLIDSATGAIGVDVGDADADDDLDLWVTTDQGAPDNGLTLLANDGAGNLTRSDIAKSGAGRRLLIADMNADAYPDVVSGLGHNSFYDMSFVTVFTADGQGGLRIAEGEPQEPHSLWPRDALVRDITGDDIPDLFANILGSTTAVLRRGVGDGSFAEPEHEFTPFRHGATDAADFNEDGLTDLVGDGPQLLLALDAPGFFGSLRTPEPTPGEFAVAVADINADGLVDLAANEYDAIGIYLGNGLGDFSKVRSIDVTGCPFTMELVDVTGTPLPDLVCTDLCANGNDGAVVVYENRGNARFRFAWSIPAHLPWRLATADLNRDGRNDVVAGSLDSADVYVLMNDAGNAFALTTIPVGSPDQTYNERVPLTGDIDADGAIDLLVLGDANDYALFNQGDGTFAAPTPVGPATNGLPILADVDRDLTADLVYPDAGAVKLRRGRTDRSFDTPQIIAPDTNAGSLAAGDVTGDGRTDVVCYGAGLITLIPTGPDKSFTTPEVYANPASDEDVIRLAHVDDDGALDALTLSPYSYSPINTHLNRLPPAPVPCIGDLDGDADTDAMDMAILIGNFAQPVATGADGDLDNDANVDIFDFALFAENFGCVTQPSAAR